MTGMGRKQKVLKVPRYAPQTRLDCDDDVTAFEPVPKEDGEFVKVSDVKARLYRLAELQHISFEKANRIIELLF